MLGRVFKKLTVGSVGSGLIGVSHHRRIEYALQVAILQAVVQEYNRTMDSA